MSKISKCLFFNFLTGAIFLVSCERMSEKEMFIIPYNYEGMVIVIFNVSKGENVKYKNGYRMYEIPIIGVLKTEFDPNYGLLLNPNKNSIFYQRDSLGALKQLKVNWKNEKYVDSNKMINYQESGSYNGVDYFRFIISEPSISDTFIFKNGFEEMAWFDSIIR